PRLALMRGKAGKLLDVAATELCEDGGQGQALESAIDNGRHQRLCKEVVHEKSQFELSAATKCQPSGPRGRASSLDSPTLEANRPLGLYCHEVTRTRRLL